MFFKYFLQDGAGKVRIGYLQGESLSHVEAMLKASKVQHVIGLTEHLAPDEFYSKRELYVFESEKDGKKMIGTIEHVHPGQALKELEGEYALPIRYLYPSHEPFDLEKAIAFVENLRKGDENDVQKQQMERDETVQSAEQVHSFTDNIVQSNESVSKENSEGERGTIPQQDIASLQKVQIMGQQVGKSHTVLDAEFNALLNDIEKRLPDIMKDKQFELDVMDMKDTLATFRKREVTTAQDKFDVLKFLLRGFSYIETTMDPSPMKPLLAKQRDAIIALLTKIEGLESKSAFGMTIEKNGSYNNPLDNNELSDEALRYLSKRDVVKHMVEEVEHIIDDEEAGKYDDVPEDVSMKLIIAKELPLFLDVLILFFFSLIVISQLLTLYVEKLVLFDINFSKVFAEFASSGLYMKTVLFLVLLYAFVHTVRFVAEKSGVIIMMLAALLGATYYLVFVL